MGSYCVLTLFVFLVDGVFGDSSGLSPVSVMEGEPVVLHTGVVKQQRDKMLWYFNDILIAQINGHLDTSCLYDGDDGRFKDRLEVDYETGSLIITNIRSEHTGRYEAELIQSKSSGTSTSLNRNSKCDSTKIKRKMSNIGDTIKTFIVSLNPLPAPHSTSEELDETGKEREYDRSSGLFAVVVGAGVAVAVLMLVCVAVAVGVIYYHRRRSTNAEVEKTKLEHLLNA